MYHFYTEEQKLWIIHSNQQKEWRDRKELLSCFNDHFGLSVKERSLYTFMRSNGIVLNSVQNNNKYTKKQLQWVEDNLNIKAWKDVQEFCDTFNAIFGTNKTYIAMTVLLDRHKWVVNTQNRRCRQTSEQTQWLKDNYNNYSDLSSVTGAYNIAFGTNVSVSAMSQHCVKLGLKRDTRFKKGTVRNNTQSIGTISYKNGVAYIKTKESDGTNKGFVEPYWTVLKKKIWEDNFGKVPKGYCVVSLTNNQDERDISNLAIIDRRYTTIMAKQGWWTDNRVITADAVQWCNLYGVAKDKNIL